MKCSNCNAEVGSGEGFCSECGHYMRGTLAPPRPEEKIVFNVTLTNAGERKVHVVKEARALTGLSLKEAKGLVKAAPKRSVKVF